MKLAIIIVNWNTGALLSQCLESIYQCPPSEKFIVMVVDNASTDDSVELARYSFPQAGYIVNAENRGFAAANNMALRQAEAEYVLLLNPDTRLISGALDELLQFLDQRPTAGAVGARLLHEDGSLQFSCSPEPTFRGELLRLLHLGTVRADGYYAMQDWDLSEPRLVDTILGACMLVRQSALDQIGLLDEDYFIYSEEVDLCRRLRQAGWKIFWDPKAQVIHLGGQSTRQAAPEMFIQLYQAKVQYFRKYYGRLGAFIYKLILFFASLARLVPALLLVKFGTELEHIQILKGNYQRLLKALPGL